MKPQVAVAFVGLIAFANAYSGLTPPAVRKLQTVPIAKTYAAPVAAPVRVEVEAAPVSVTYEEEPIVEEKIVYKAPVRHVERAPIRVVHKKEEEPYVHTSSGGRGGYGGSSLDARTEAELDYNRNANAKYHFASAVDDGIMDNSHIRQETRDGLKVTGSYAYSDGFFKRTVNYEADENGYRVVGESVEPISETGPIVDLVNGKAEVHTQIHGVQTQYSVSADELLAERKKLATLKKDVYAGAPGASGY